LLVVDGFRCEVAFLGPPLPARGPELRAHRDDRYDRLTDDVEQVTGHPPQSVEQYIAAHRDLFASASLTTG